MGKSHRQRSRVIEFDKKEEMMRFILLYRDRFIPYSDDTIRCESYVEDFDYGWKEGNKQKRTRGHHNEHIIKMMEQGYLIKDKTLRVNLLPEDWSFIKDSLSLEYLGIRGRKIYRYVSV